uniref:Uncharacterized protein n=2 Tax=gambiae species complex TaxID=44542 RepID=A0A8W7P479_ANOCL
MNEPVTTPGRDDEIEPKVQTLNSSGMSLKRLAVISAVGSHNSFNNQTISYISSYSGASGSVEQGVIVGHGSGGSGSLRTGGHHQGLQTMRPGANLHGNVNIMLGGAMLSVVITVVCFVCYCCHRNIKKRSNSLYRQQWLDADTNMEIYSVEQEEEEEDVGQSSSRRCSNHELHECDKQSVCADGATPLLLPKTSRPPGNGDVSVASIVRRPYSDDPDEPTLCRSVVEPDWSEEGDHHRTSCNCPAVVATSGGGEGSIAGPPIYCRNCGYFVATGSPALERRNHRRSHRRNLPIERARNETLLVDYETPASDVVNRNNVTDDGGTGQTGDTVDIDMQTTMAEGSVVFDRPLRRLLTTGSRGQERQHRHGRTPVQPAATGPSPSSSGSPGSLLNENGLVRLDMSQIIDNTGLPTYEAALKLESSGYV